MQNLFFLLFALSFTALLAQDATGEPFVCPPCNRKCCQLTFAGPGICEHCNMQLVPAAEAKKIPKRKRRKVGFYLQSGVEILDLAGPMEVFAYAGYEVFTISKNKNPLYAQGILTVIPDYDLTDAPQADILAFFGGNAVIPSQDKTLIDWVRSRRQTNYFFSVCSGVLILAEAGILDQQKATTFRYTLDPLEKNYPEVEVLRGVRYVDNGTVITTAGVSACIDGALHLVAKLEGLAAAANVAFYMEYDWTPDRGLADAADDPYRSMRDLDLLKEYAGTFVTSSGKQIQLVLDEERRELNLLLAGKSYPVFLVKKDKLLTSHASHFFEFSRNLAGKITGLTSTEFSETFKKR
ncbi:MAG: DJ-1/PfpI family protein [Bacteroidota bacterium]